MRAKFNIKASCATVRRSAMKMKWSKKSTRYCQIVSEENKVKRMIYANFCNLTDELFDDCIFIDEAIIEFNVYAPTRWRYRGERNYKVGKPKHPLKVFNCHSFLV